MTAVKVVHSGQKTARERTEKKIKVKLHTQTH